VAPDKVGGRITLLPPPKTRQGQAFSEISSINAGNCSGSVISNARWALAAKPKVFLDLSPKFRVKLGGRGAFFAQFMPQSYSSSGFSEKFLENSRNALLK
jgi:hypothetical protein